MPKIARLYLHPSWFCKTRRNPFVSRGRLEVVRRKAPAVLGGGGVTVTSSNTHSDSLLIRSPDPRLTRLRKLLQSWQNSYGYRDSACVRSGGLQGGSTAETARAYDNAASPPLRSTEHAERLVCRSMPYHPHAPKHTNPARITGLITESLLGDSDTQLAEDRATRLDRETAVAIRTKA